MSVKKVISGSLASMLLVSIMAGCSSNDDKSNSTSSPTAINKASAKPNEEVTITIWDQDVPKDGIQNNAVADVIAQKTGVRMNFVKGDAQKFKVLIAAGDLPDIVYFNNTYLPTPKAFVDSNQLIPLDDLVNSVGKNLKTNFPEKLDYSRKFISETKQLYFIPMNSFKNEGNSVPSFYGAGIMNFARWDLYAKAGYPQVENEDEYLDMLAKIQAANPKTADGKKIYAMGAWSDWGYWPFWIPYAFSNGIGEGNNSTLIDSKTGKIENAFYSDSFWNSVRFFNKAYNKGLLDQESFTQTYNDYVGKAKNGQYIYLGINGTGAVSGINEALAAIDPKMGYEVIPTGVNFLNGIYNTDAPYGWQKNFAAAITKKCKNPEKAMELLDYLAGSEGSRLLKNGVEGIHWEKKNGIDVFTQGYVDKSAKDPNYKINEGIGAYKYLGGFAGPQIVDGNPVDISNSPSVMAQSLKQVDKDFIEYYNTKDNATYKYPGQALEASLKKGIWKTSTDISLPNMLLASPSADTTTILSQVTTTLQTEITRLIILPTNKLEDGIKSTIKKLDDQGYKKAAAEIDTLIAAAQKAATDFKP